MKIGLVGYRGVGQEHAVPLVEGVAPDPALAHTGQSAMAPIPDPRVEQLCQIYHPKKVTLAAIELVDTPGLSRTHEGNATRLAMIREAGCLVFVVAVFDGADPPAEIRSFDEDLVLADMEIVANRIHRVEDSLKKPVPRLEHQQLEHEHATLKIVLAAMETGQPLRESHMTEEQQKVTRSFRLLSEKPRLVIVNTADDESQPGAIHFALYRGGAGDGRARRLGTRTVEDDAARPLGIRAGDGPDGYRPRPSAPHAAGDFRPDDLFHRRREGGPHVAAAAGRDGGGGRRRHPHRSGPRLHPRRSDDRQPTWCGWAASGI